VTIASVCFSSSMYGDVNISAILDSFSGSYDKRVRPNYGGELYINFVLFYNFYYNNFVNSIPYTYYIEVHTKAYIYYTCTPNTQPLIYWVIFRLENRNDIINIFLTLSMTNSIIWFKYSLFFYINDNTVLNLYFLNVCITFFYFILFQVYVYTLCIVMSWGIYIYIYIHTHIYEYIII
jgi:hypothetical protein